MVVGSIRSKKMILITLGTQDKEFTRILKEVDKLITKKVIKEEVVVQAGYTKYKSKNMKIFDYVSKTELEKYIEKASFVITHAGVGTIFDCLKKNKKIKNSLLLSLSRKSLIFLDSFKYVYFIFLRSNIGIYLPTIYLD